MEENTLINSSSSLVSGSEGESNTLAPDKSTLESENWGGDFCNSDNIDSDSTEFEIGGLHYGPYSDDDGGLHYGPYSDDDGFRYETKETNFVWDGWEAALIVSKRMLADYYVKSSSEKEDSRKVLTLEPYETHFGKSNVRQTLELEGSGLATRKVSWLFYPYLGKEDFERIFDQSVVEAEYSKLCEILDSCKCDPLVAIAEGKVKVDQFSTLREHDLCDTIRQHKCSAERKVKADQFSKLREHDIYDDRTQLYPCSAKKEVEVLRPWVFPIFGPEWNDISPNEVAIALEMLRNYEPLKLQYFQEAVIFPLSDGCFGPFTDEFIEVIKIADHERRMQGDRFISVKHLLFGLSLSSVRRCVEMMLHGRVLDYTGQLALKLSSFSIYKLSRDAATILGDKNVGLEHLVLAIFYGKQENDRTGTAAQDDCSSLFFDEKKWDDYLLKHHCYPKIVCLLVDRRHYVAFLSRMSCTRL
ncbi:uncharacterized protein LOC114297121 isoform X4 [Camellia sinensis]|uniref:uncharacterized protein LOC114297121 isoform X4 n=1 Tax=Camellia sinensis TaxID=4442 RepID=UPI0010356194|nr:uncharacterized protein LOC114297121 isoform X4 [Camellia sinensis]